MAKKAGVNVRTKKKNADVWSFAEGVLASAVAVALGSAVLRDARIGGWDARAATKDGGRETLEATRKSGAGSGDRTRRRFGSRSPGWMTLVSFFDAFSSE